MKRRKPAVDAVQRLARQPRGQLEPIMNREEHYWDTADATPFCEPSKSAHPSTLIQENHDLATTNITEYIASYNAT